MTIQSDKRTKTTEELRETKWRKARDVALKRLALWERKHAAALRKIAAWKKKLAHAERLHTKAVCARVAERLQRS